MEKQRAKNNRTLTLEPEETAGLRNKVLDYKSLSEGLSIENRLLLGDTLSLLPSLPDEFADLIIIDPPYNLSKNFNGLHFNARSSDSYEAYLQSWFPAVCKKLKKDGFIYPCTCSRKEVYGRPAACS